MFANKHELGQASNNLVFYFLRILRARRLCPVDLVSRARVMYIFRDKICRARTSEVHSITSERTQTTYDLRHPPSAIHMSRRHRPRRVRSTASTSDSEKKWFFHNSSRSAAKIIFSAGQRCCWNEFRVECCREKLCVGLCRVQSAKEWGADVQERESCVEQRNWYKN